MRILAVLSSIFLTIVVSGCTQSGLIVDPLPQPDKTSAEPSYDMPTSRTRVFPAHYAFWTLQDRGRLEDNPRGTRTSSIGDLRLILVESEFPNGNIITEYSLTYWIYNNTAEVPSGHYKGYGKQNLTVYFKDSSGNDLPNSEISFRLDRKRCYYGGAKGPIKEVGTLDRNYIDSIGSYGLKWDSISGGRQTAC